MVRGCFPTGRRAATARVAVAARTLLVLVPVAFVGCVPVPVVQVVGVGFVGYCHVAALRPVLVGVPLMRRVLCSPAFVHMVAVETMDVALICIVDVLAVRERDVTAALAVNVLVTGVCGVLSGVRHCDIPLCG